MDMPFSPWAPDRFFGTGAIPKAENVIAKATGYWGIPGPAASGQRKTYEGFANILFYEISTLREAFTFLGTDTDLYRITDLIEEITRNGGATPYAGLVGGAVSWSKIAYSDNVYLVNGKDPLQRYTLGGGGDAVDIDTTPNSDGTGGTELFTNMTGRYNAVVRDFHIIGNCISDEATYANRVWWSGIGLPESFDPDPSTMSDYQDIPDLGEVRGITGGEYCTVLMERGVVRMDFVGPPVVFTFKPYKISDGIGCDISNTVLRAKSGTFFHSQHGWVMFNGQILELIGNDLIDQWWNRDKLTGQDHRIVAAALPNLQCLGWLYVSNDAPTYPVGHPNAGLRIPDKILLYNLDDKQWTIALVTAEVIGNGATDTAATLEDLDSRPPAAGNNGDYDSIDTPDGDDPTQWKALDHAGYFGPDVAGSTTDASGARPAPTAFIPITLDSDLFRGTAGALASCFRQEPLDTTNSGFYNTFQGLALPAIVDTDEVQLAPGKRAVLRSAVPFIRGTALSVELEIITKTKYTPGSETISQRYLESPDGTFKLRNEGRFHRIRAHLASGESWRELHKISVEFTEKGSR